MWRRAKKRPSESENKSMKPKTAGYALRLPVALKAEAERLAAAEGSSLNQFIVKAVAEKVSSLSSLRAASGDRRSAGDEAAGPGVDSEEVANESV